MEFNLNKFKERALTIDSIGLLYILVVGGLSHILSIPKIIILNNKKNDTIK